MAKVISDEILKLKIVINGDQAQKEVLDLERANNSLSIRLNDLKKTQSDLSKQRKKDSVEYKQNQKEIESLTGAISKNNQEITKLVKEMDVASLTMQQLRGRAKDLQFVMTNMNPNSPEYRNAQAEMGRLNSRMNELRTGTNGAALSVRNLAERFNHYQGIALAVGAVLTGVALSIKSTIDLNNKLADAQTAVAKTVGITKEEVEDLTRAFSTFDTRTSKIDLLKIAETGGRLGVPKAEIKDFVQEVDKANVALGDGFAGGVEAVTNTLGKLKNLYRETKDLDMATAINQIGSAMNELGAAGAASEENIGDFALRLGSLPDRLKPTIAESLALGAAFEESGIEAQRAGTAYSAFIRAAAKDAGKFAEVMKISKKEVEDLMNKDPLEFFLKFSEGAKGLDTVELAKMLDYLKLNDQYVISTMGAASENTDRFRTSIKLSNKALTEATSLQDEFNKVNNNSAAIYDKVQKKMLGMFTSRAVAGFLNTVIEGFGKMIGAVEDADGRYQAFARTLVFLAKIIAVGVVAIFSYNASMLLAATTTDSLKTKLLSYTIVQKVNNLLNQTGAVLQNLWNFAIGTGQMALGRLTGATTLQTAAQARLNLVTMANPWGAVITVITTLIGVYLAWKTTTDQNIKAQKNLNQVLNEGSKSAAEEVTQLDLLYKKATDNKIATEERYKAIVKLQELYPSYFGNIDKEVILNGKAEKSYYALRDAIIASARADAAREELKTRQAARIKRDGDLEDKINAETGTRNSLKANPRDKTMKLDGGDGKGFNVTLKGEDMLNASRERLSNLKKAKENNKKADAVADKIWIDAIYSNERRSALYNKDKNRGDGSGPMSNYNTNVGGPEEKKAKAKGKTAAEKAAEKELKEFEKLKEKILQSAKDYDQKFLDQESEFRMEKINQMEDGYEKELAKIEEEEYKKRVAINKNINRPEDYAEIKKVIDRTKGAEKVAFEEIRQEMLDSDAHYNQMEILAIEDTELKKKTLREKFATEQLKKDEKNFIQKTAKFKEEENLTVASLRSVEEQKAFLKDKISANELSKIKTWEDGKVAVQKYYQEESLTLQADYLNELIKQLENLPAASLTTEQIEALEAMRLKLSEILVTKQEISQGKKDDFSALNSFGGGTDLLGLSTDQWKAMLTSTDDVANNIKKIGAAIQVAQNIMATYFEYVKVNEEAQLRSYETANERKKRSLKRQLDSGYINQETYKKLTIQADAELDKKKAELEYKAAKRQKAMAIAQAITSTALAIMGIWRDFPKVDFGATAAIMSGVVGALGALQLATIIRQPLPSATGAEDGFYPVLREQDGKRFNARKRVSKTGIYNEPTMLVGEAGNNFPELVVSGKTMKRIDPQIQKIYMQEISRIEGFEKGLYPGSNQSASNDDLTIQMMSLISKNIEVLNEIKDFGIKAYIEKSARNGKDILEMQKDYEKINNRNKYK